MAVFNLLGTNFAAREPFISAERRLNVYYDDMRAEPEKGPIACYSVPGANYHSNPTNGQECRGTLYVPSQGYIYAMFGNSLWKMDTAGAWTLVGSTSEASNISTQVAMADSGYELIVACSSYLYNLNYGTGTFTDITSSLPETPNTTIAFLGGYFIAGTSNVGEYMWSDPGDGTTWPALNVNLAYKKGDAIRNLTAYKDNLVIFGTYSIEFHGLTGDALGEFGPVAGAVTEIGGANKFNPRVVNDSIIFIGRPIDGPPRYYKLTGYDVEDITPPGLAYKLANFSEASVVSGSTGTFTLGGDQFYVHRVGGDDGFGLMYGIKSGLWYELEGTTPDSQIPFLYWATNGAQINSSGFAQSATFVFGTEGNVYYFDPDVGRWDGKHYRKQIVSPHLTDSRSGNFIKINKVRVEAASGLLGFPQTFILEVSRDGGRTWGNELWCDTGAKGDYTQILEWRRLGIARDFVFRLTMPEGKIAVTRAFVEYEVLRK